MSNVDFRPTLDLLLNQLGQDKSIDVAEKIIAEIVNLLGIKVSDRFLLNVPRIDAELSRFMLAPGFGRQAAAYEIPNDHADLIDLKLFWIKKASKTNLSWLIGITPNFEDSETNDYKNISIDFVVPEECDRLIIVLSNRYKIRLLELKDHLTHTQYEILSEWINFNFNEQAELNDLKNKLHNSLWESFNFEPVSKKFYLELVESYSILVSHLNPLIGKKHSVAFTTRLIGRLLFVWFLRKKNFINDSHNYFTIESPSNQTEYYKSKLEVLFFEILNREKNDRETKDDHTPYLNGGLFDFSESDHYQDEKISIPNGFFNNLYLTLSKYNFTVDESSPEYQHVAIDPEMLGRVFETLLAEHIDEVTGNTRKKSTGAFYTPREVVSYMCSQALIEFLRNRVPYTPDRDRRLDELVNLPESLFRDQDQNKRRDWKPYSTKIIESILGDSDNNFLTVLDPAVGSGAFPMGMLHLLIKVLTRLDPKYEKNISKLKREILSRSLYGVDVEQTAIEICRLRAWLSIIVDISDTDLVTPLPNLEFKFTCANALIPLDESRQHNLFEDQYLKDNLIKIRDEYFNTSDKRKKTKLQNDYHKLTHGEQLFDTKKTKQLKSYKPFDVNATSEFYDPELHHGIDSFDIVIGNPPYQDYRKIDKSITSLDFFPIARASNRPNLFQYFVEVSDKFLKPNGILTFINPNQFLSTDNGFNLRNFLLKDRSLQFFVDVSYIDVFREASTYTVIWQYQKTNDHRAVIRVNRCLNLNQLDKTSFNLDYALLLNSKSKIIPLNLDFFILEGIEKNKKKLSDIASLKWGTSASGYGRKKISQITYSELKKAEKCLYKPILQTADIKSFKISWVGEYIPIDVFSQAIQANFNKRKIVVGRLTKTIQAAIDLEYFYVGKATIIYDSKIDLYVLLAIINSRFINRWYFLKYESTHLAGGYIRYDVPYLSQIPIPDLNTQQCDILKGFSLSLIKNISNQRVFDDVLQKLNIYIYKIYGFSFDQLKAFDIGFEITLDEFNEVIPISLFE